MQLAKHEQKTAIPNFLGLVLVISLIAYRIYNLPPDQVPLINAVTTDQWIAPTLFAFMLLGQLRIWLGVNLIDFDMTVRSALWSLRIKEKTEKKQATIQLLKGLTFVSIGFFGVQIGASALGTLLALGSQVLLLVIYDLLLFRELLYEDIERSANKFILIGDLFAVLFTVLIAVEYTGWPVSLSDSLFNILAIGVCGGILAVFIGESWAHYFEAVLILINRAFRPEKSGNAYASLSVSQIDDEAMRIGRQDVVYDGERELQPLLVDRFLSGLETDCSKILEVGYGLGFAAAAFNSSERVAYHKIIEVHPERASEAKNEFGEDRVIEGDWRDLHSEIRETFDGVYFDTTPLVNRKVKWTVNTVAEWILPAMETFYPLLAPKGLFAFIDLTNQLKHSPAFFASKNVYYSDCIPETIKTPMLADRSEVTLVILRRRDSNIT